MASRITKGEWTIATTAAGIVDAAQWGVDLIPVFGEAANAIADPIIGILMVGYFWFRGVNLFQKPQRVLAIILGGLAEELSLEVLPAWIFDVWYIRSSVMEEEAQMAALEEQEMLLANVPNPPLYRDGVRMPDAERTRTINSLPAKRNDNNMIINMNPSNKNGIRVAGPSHTGSQRSSK